LALLVGMGCACADYDTGGYDDDTGDDDVASDDDDMADDDDDDDSGDDDTGDDDDTTDVGPCADDGWGEIPVDERPEYLVVSTTGMPTGDGSVGNPYDTIEAALEHARASGGEWLIGIAEGEYTIDPMAGLELGEEDEGLWIAGCSAEAVILTVGGTDMAGIAVRQTNGIQLRSLTVKGGMPAIAVTQQSGADAPIVLNDIRVSEAVGVGIVIDGTTGKSPTVAEMEAIQVSGTTTIGDQLGWGVAVQGAQASLLDVTISNVTQVGLFGHMAEIEVERLTVDGVAVDAAGTFGRGVHLQLFTDGAIRDSDILNCADAGVFLNACDAMILSDLDVSLVGAAVIPNSVSLSGDGIVASAGTLGFDPSWHPVTAANNNVHDNARAGIVLDGVEGEVDGGLYANNIFLPGGWGVVSQNGGSNNGADDTYALPGDFDILDLNLDVLPWLVVSND